MIAGKIEKIMKSAIKRFAEREGVEAKTIALMIHTKTEDHAPLYFYTLSGKPKKDENGDLANLRFVEDVMGKRLDALGYQGHAHMFFTSYFKTLANEFECNASLLYIMICMTEDSELTLGVYKHEGTGVVNIKKMTLEEVFGD